MDPVTPTHRSRLIHTEIRHIHENLTALIGDATDGPLIEMRDLVNLLRDSAAEHLPESQPPQPSGDLTSLAPTIAPIDPEVRS